MTQYGRFTDMNNDNTTQVGAVRRTATESVGTCEACGATFTAARTSDAASALWAHVGECAAVRAAA